MIAWGTDQEHFARTQGREYKPSIPLVFATGLFIGLFWGAVIGGLIVWMAR